MGSRFAKRPRKRIRKNRGQGMKIGYLHIKNFKSIRDLEIKDLENALILVGKNNTGKTAVIDAIRAVSGDYIIEKKDYGTDEKSISIEMRVFFDEKDLALFHRKGIASKYKKFDQIGRAHV